MKAGTSSRPGRVGSRDPKRSSVAFQATPRLEPLTLLPTQHSNGCPSILAEQGLLVNQIAK